jgi:hypothetical protein
MDTAKRIDELIEEPGGYLLEDADVGRVIPDGVDDLKTFFPFLYQRGNYLGGVLQISIHGDYCVPESIIQSGAQSCLMAEIPGQFQHPDFSRWRRPGNQLPKGIVGAPSSTKISSIRSRSLP